MPEPDLVVVGGGIAGCALATAMARQGASVLVLERQQAYSDHVRGEIIWPWGVRVARLLGVEQPLLDAGALVVRWLDEYDEAEPGPARIDVGGVVDGVGGSLNITHPAACAALAEAAAAAGADVRAGIRELEVAPGSPPSVRWSEDGAEHEARPGLVVGADGRRSTVRAQAGIEYEVDEPTMFFVGMLAEAIEGVDEDVNVIAREADLLFFSLPEEAGRAAPVLRRSGGPAAPLLGARRGRALPRRVHVALRGRRRPLGACDPGRAVRDVPGRGQPGATAARGGRRPDRRCGRLRQPAPGARPRDGAAGRARSLDRALGAVGPGGPGEVRGRPGGSQAARKPQRQPRGVGQRRLRPPGSRAPGLPVRAHPGRRGAAGARDVPAGRLRRASA